jgi:protein TonB
LIVSIFIHGLLFIFSGPTFIQQAQFSVQPSAQMVEVSIVSLRGTSETSDEVRLRRDLANPKDWRTISERTTKSEEIATQPAVARNDNPIVRSISGVKVKANPDYFQNPAPEYPELAKQMRQEGLVILAVDVDRIGVPIRVEIKQSSGYRLLDQAAVKTVSHWKFQPGRMGDIPVESSVTIPIRYRLVLIPDTHSSSEK